MPKRSPSSSPQLSATPYPELVEDQMAGRVIRVLGGLNMLVYCNDRAIRVCHICGRMRGREWVSLGDHVLLSLRDFSELRDCAPMISKGDILAKYSQDHIGKLKRENGFNPELLLTVDQLLIMSGMKDVALPEDDLFE